jgi:hypothetical protein
VQAHPHTHLAAFRPLVIGERPLRLDDGDDRILGAREGEKERVALRVDLVPAVSLEGSA